MMDRARPAQRVGGEAPDGGEEPIMEGRPGVDQGDPGICKWLVMNELCPAQADGFSARNG